MNFILHTAMDTEAPWKNQTVISHTREDIIKRSGSRYAPSSPCEAIAAIEKSDKPCVFIGKPCDAAAVSQVRKIRPQLDKNLGLVLSFFCAGTPCTNATLDLLTKYDVNKEMVRQLHYRGNGWPGFFRAEVEQGKELQLTYEESWGYLAGRHRQLRCYLCPDGFGQFADITSGDAWHRKGEKNNDGCSFVLVRSERGQQLLHQAQQAGYLTLSQSHAGTVVLAQQLSGRRKTIAGRLLALRLFGLPYPRYNGFFLRKLARGLNTFTRLKNFFGMIKRIVIRKLYKKIKIKEPSEV